MRNYEFSRADDLNSNSYFLFHVRVKIETREKERVLDELIRLIRKRLTHDRKCFLLMKVFVAKFSQLNLEWTKKALEKGFVYNLQTRNDFVILWGEENLSKPHLRTLPSPLKSLFRKFQSVKFISLMFKFNFINCHRVCCFKFFLIPLRKTKISECKADLRKNTLKKPQVRWLGQRRRKTTFPFISFDDVNGFFLWREITGCEKRENHIFSSARAF